ncbi:DNA helicase, Rad3 [Halogeometricum borinquense DSM 11551]|uniref:DNA helicase, Rad3 n=2 Tax=Halogeometricum borinquense (strain ATCC 700274 / DSM 11551 / JCM 10706 / KCTC 4070 / PR3) TaxID=469382 RepID=E4NSA7_HALBP|nr:DNA helicase, Rad3 [Halogeometricum borinquense DSM 11551]
MAETSGYMRFFPYDRPYPNQGEAMDGIAEALEAERDVLVEGAPGTGKTLSALVPAVEYARQEDKTVVITTNVHQQMRQFVEDARAITRTEPIRAVVFKGKSSMCHIDVEYQECQTLRDTTRSLVEKEQDKAELSEQADALVDRMRAGEQGAADARTAVTDELDTLEDELEDLREGNICEYYYNNLTEDTDEFFSWLFDDVRTPEDIYEYADQRKLCGYELLKEGMEEVDLVVCNYHHLLDPNIREQFFRWLNREPEDVITVFDEAHNIESAARDHASRALTENTLEQALNELEDTDDSRADSAENVISAFLDALKETYDEAFGFGEREQVGEDWYDLPIANNDRRDDLTLAFLDRYEGRGISTEVELALQLGKRLDDEYEEAYKDGEATTRQECQTLQAATFIDTWMADGGKLGQHPMCSVRRDGGTDEVYGRAELYTCIPREVTETLFEEVHASILMSATLRPFDVTEDVLGLSDPATMAYGLAYPEENRHTIAVQTPALFSSEREEPATQETLTQVLTDASRFTPGNTLVFFPSYAEAERYHERLQARMDVTDRLFLDESGTPTEEIRSKFVESQSAILLTSLWGTLAEGVSFDGDDARTVVVVGVPYPHLSERMEAIQDAYDRVYSSRREAGWRYAVEIPTIRKTRQALGRVIRSPDDFGVRILADKRYTRASSEMGKYGVRSTFPPEERAEIVDVSAEKLKFAMLNFYGDHDAYDGDPPRP